MAKLDIECCPICGAPVTAIETYNSVSLEYAAPSWISVDERLPEYDVDVLVYAVGNNENSCVVMTSYTHHMYGYNIEGWRSPWQYFFYERKITHWMPLPEAPKEDEHAQTD